MEELSLDVALDIVGTLRVLKSKEANDETNDEKKVALEKEIDLLFAEEKIIYRNDDNSDMIRTSVMDKVKRLYAPILKNYYAN